MHSSVTRTCSHTRGTGDDQRDIVEHTDSSIQHAHHGASQAIGKVLGILEQVDDGADCTVDARDNGANCKGARNANRNHEGGKQNVEPDGGAGLPVVVGAHGVAVRRGVLLTLRDPVHGLDGGAEGLKWGMK